MNKLKMRRSAQFGRSDINRKSYWPDSTYVETDNYGVHMWKFLITGDSFQTWEVGNFYQGPLIQFSGTMRELIIRCQKGLL